MEPRPSKTWAEALAPYGLLGATLLYVGALIQGGISPQDVKETVWPAARVVHKEQAPTPGAHEVLPPEADPEPAPPKPKPKPKPKPRPSPKPEPLPTPAGPMILVTGELSRVLTESTVEAGQLFLVTASNEGKVGWTVSSYGDVRLLILPNNLGYSFSLGADSFVEFFLTDTGLNSTSVRISCGQGPRPPPTPVPDPVPVPPEPKPAPVPPKPHPTAPNVALVVVANTTHPSPQEAIVMNALGVWDEFKTAGNSYIFYDITSTEPAAVAAKTDAIASGATLPVLLIYDKETRTKLAALPLPSSVKGLREIVAQYTEVR